MIMCSPANSSRAAAMAGTTRRGAARPDAVLRAFVEGPTARGNTGQQ